MNASLRRDYDRIRALLETAPETIESRHAVGLIVAAVKRDPERYGKQPVGLLASALGRDEATLYRFAQVASRWTTEELARWVERARSSKSPLSWWHFVEASAVARKRDREELLRKMLEERLSVGALTRPAEETGRMRRSGAHLVREVEVLVRRAATLRERWGRLRGAANSEAGRALSTELLDRARASCAALVDTSRQILDDVEALRAASRTDEDPSLMAGRKRRPMMLFMQIRFSVAAAAIVFAAATTVRAETDALSRPMDRSTILIAAVQSHPGVRAAAEKALAASLAADAEGRLPPPQAMVEIWQVPLERPYAISDAQMIMFGVGQSIPAPGSRAALERAGQHVAGAERAMGEDRARQIRRDADHAFADYVEATERHRIHLEHRAVAERALLLARSRHAAGASLSDAVQAEVELARVESDVVTDRTRVEGARARLNALLGRELGAPLGSPISGEAEIAAWDARTAAAKAREARPELRAADEQRSARSEEARAAEREATLPSFSVAALYFAPTSPMPQHGYGVNASVSLPWLWGEARSKRDARRQAAKAAGSEALAAKIPIDAEVATSEANMRASALRLQALRDRALPASRRAFDVAWAGYESARTDILTLLSARRAVVDVESEVVAARASLDHAFADLEAAVGTSIPRRTLGPLDPKELDGRNGHVR